MRLELPAITTEEITVPFWYKEVINRSLGMRPSYQTYYTKVDKDWNGLYKIELGGRVASGEDKLKRYVEILKRKSGKTELKRELEKEWLNDNIEIITEDEFEELKSEILEELVD